MFWVISGCLKGLGDLGDLGGLGDLVSLFDLIDLFNLGGLVDLVELLPQGRGPGQDQEGGGEESCLDTW